MHPRHPFTPHQPVVVYSKPKEGGFFLSNTRPDYALVDADGAIFEPTLSELRARAIVRYAEVHDKTAPYQVAIGGGEGSGRRRRRRRLRRG